MDEESLRKKIAAEIRAYGDQTHPAHSQMTTCLRCDITAAYRHAAQIALGSQP